MSTSEMNDNFSPSFWLEVTGESLSLTKHRKALVQTRKKIATDIAKGLAMNINELLTPHIIDRLPPPIAEHLAIMSEPHPALVDFLESLLETAQTTVFSDGLQSIIRFDDPYAHMPSYLFEEELSYGQKNGYVPLVDFDRRGKPIREYIFVKHDGNEEFLTQQAKLLTAPTHMQLLDSGALGQRILYIAIQANNDLAVRAITDSLPSKSGLSSALSHFYEREKEIIQQCIDAARAEMDLASRREARQAKKARRQERKCIKRNRSEEKQTRIDFPPLDPISAVEEEMALQNIAADLDVKTRSAHNRWVHERGVVKQLDDAVRKLTQTQSTGKKIKHKRTQLKNARQRQQNAHKEWQTHKVSLDFFRNKLLHSRLRRPTISAIPASVRELFRLQAIVDFLHDESKNQTQTIEKKKDEIARRNKSIDELAREGKIEGRNKAINIQHKAKRSLKRLQLAAQEITRHAQRAETALQRHMERNSLTHMQGRPPEYLRPRVTTALRPYDRMRKRSRRVQIFATPKQP